MVKQPSVKWTLIAIFDVMHYFIYQASQSLDKVEEGIDCLKKLLYLFTKVCTQFLVNRDVRNMIVA